MERKIHVLFFITSLAGGGAERVLLTLLQYLDRSIFAPALCLLRKEGELLSEVPNDITVHSLEMRGTSIGRQFVPMVMAMKRLLKNERPDVVVSFLWEPNLINACVRSLFRFCPAILSERNATGIRFDTLFGKGLKSSVAMLLTKALYKRGDHIISVSAGSRDELLALGVKEDRITVIHNPLNVDKIEQMSGESFDHERPFILYAGRLAPQKNVQLLLITFARICGGRDIDLIILGQGGELDALRKLADELHITPHVFFKGFDPNPYRYMTRADAFVLPSKFEGFPNVLLEAMLLGAPVVSTDCPHGPSEIIEQGRNGILVPTNDEDAMTTSLESILNDKALKEKLIKEGRKTAAQFSPEKVVKQYEVLIQYMNENGQRAISRA